MMQRPCDLVCRNKAQHTGLLAHAQVSDSSPMSGAYRDPIQLSVRNRKRLNFKTLLGAITCFFVKCFETSRIYT